MFFAMPTLGWFTFKLSGRDVPKHLRPIFDKRADASIVSDFFQEMNEGVNCLGMTIRSSIIIMQKSKITTLVTTR
jgi:hypothetical protein